MIRIPDHRAPTHPGEMLREEFLKPLGISERELARRIDLPVHRVEEIVSASGGITADTAARLARLLGTSPDFWMNGQIAWDRHHRSA